MPQKLLKYYMDYITGEKIQSLADVSFAAATNPIIEAQLKHMNQKIYFADKIPTEIIIEALNHKKKIFVYTHFLDIFFEKVFPYLQNEFILITHNSDHNVSEKYYQFLFSDKIKNWYGQNIVFEQEKLFSLPIGIANSQWSHGNLDLLDRIRNEHNEKSILVYKNFNLTMYGNRVEINAITNVNGIYMTPQKSQEDYLRDISKSVFCICPPGNGIDCHRVWECLYLNCIPVVLNHVHYKQFQDLPILLVNDWNAVKIEFLQENISIMAKRKYNFGKLDLLYWENKINAD